MVEGDSVWPLAVVLTACQAEAVARAPCDHVHVHGEDLLEGALSVRSEGTDTFATQAHCLRADAIGIAWTKG